MASSLQELSAEIIELKADVIEKEKEAKKAMDEKEKEAKKAMDEKEKEAKKATDEKEKHEATLKAILKATEEEDKDKRAELIKAAMEEEKKAPKVNTAQDDEEKKAMKAQLEYQDKIIKLPKLQILQATYKKAGTDEKTIKRYNAEWNGMTPQQLDGAIEKLKPLIDSMGANTIPDPLSPPTGIEFIASAPINEEYSAKIEKMTTEELFA